MKVLIIQGRDAHTDGRIIAGFLNNDDSIQIKKITRHEEIDGSYFDWVFVDPSVNFDPIAKLNYGILFFYDCEDDPKHFDPDVAYFSLKDKVCAYVKMNYIQGDRNDGIKNIAFPLPVYPYLTQISQFSFPEFSSTNCVPFLLGHGTYIGKYKKEEGVNYSVFEDCQSVGVYDNGDLLYNQRLDWLMSLTKEKVPYAGGIAFSHGNLSLEWQSKYFGNGIKKYEHAHIGWNDTFQCHARFRIGLCPTGHERISWRLFDLMAAGSVIFWTDNKNQQSLIMPKHYITVKDGYSLAESILSNSGNLKDLWKASQEHKDLFSKLDSKKIIGLFLDQIK